MLFGQWENETDRQRRQIKTKMYKQMLDNQILINQRYKKTSKHEKQQHGESQLSQKRSAWKYQHKKNDSNASDLDLTVSNIRAKNNQINLPSIKDKNTYYQGSSKFIKVQENLAKPANQNPFHKQLIEEDDEDLDQYNTTCQKIIRELKSINKQSPKMKYRRKLYEYSDLAPNRNRYEKIKIEELKKSEVELYNNYDYAKSKSKYESSKNQSSPFENLSMKSKMGSDDRVPSFNLVDTSRETQPQSGKSKALKPIFDHTKFKQRQADPMNEFQQQNHTKSDNKAIKMMTQPSEPSKNIINSYANNKPTNNLERSRIKSNIEIPKNVQIISQNEKTQAQQLAGNNLKIHKENFINLLRKVKNRGQSLFIKLNAFPAKNDIK